MKTKNITTNQGNTLKILKVGGCVRDLLLGKSHEDTDYLIIGAGKEDIDILVSLGYEQVGSDFPVFLHPKTKAEYVLAMAEKKTGEGYKGFVCTTNDISLKEDLFRRDLTINAMALSIDGQIIDYFGGQEDLKKGILRHVSSYTFAEDPLRVLRVARFAARYNFKIAGETLDLMKKIVKNGELSAVSKERIWKEFDKAFNEKYIKIFFDIIKEVGAMPEFNNVRTDLFKENDRFFNILTAFKDINTGGWKMPANIKKTIGLFKKFNKTSFIELTSEGKLDFISRTRALQNKETALNIVKAIDVFNKTESSDEFIASIGKIRSLDLSEIKNYKEIKEIQLSALRA